MHLFEMVTMQKASQLNSTLDINKPHPKSQR